MTDNKDRVDLIRQIQKGAASVDLETGVVNLNNSYVGTLPINHGFLKYLKNLERQQEIEKEKIRKAIEEQQKAKDRKLESIVGSGKSMEISLDSRNSVLENIYQIFMGVPNRVIICGMNPAYNLKFDGELERIRIYADMKGFVFEEAELTNGLVHGTFDLPRHFEREIVNGKSNRVIGFGRIIDKQGFYRVRDSVKSKKGSDYND